MNARLIKETRDILPIFAGTLLLIVAPFLTSLGHPMAGVYVPLSYFAFGLACAVLGGCSFGNEFQYRTISLLLSQPIPRSVLWREKILVLGACLLVDLLLFRVCLQIFCAFPGDRVPVLGLSLVTLCAFCGAPYWTLLFRQSIGGMAFATAVPVLLALADALVVRRFFDNRAVQDGSTRALLFIYCALIYCLGYAKFKRLEAVDGPAQEVGLPAGLEAFFVRPLARVAARFQSPFATLLKKEYHLQQVSFLLAGLFVLIAVAGACLHKGLPGFADGIVGCSYAACVVILPLIAGATSLAEEKGWGIAEWHLTLPPSALKQWSAKMLAALSTSLVLGLLLPAALYPAVARFSPQVAAVLFSPPSRFWWCNWMLGSLLVTSVAIYGATFTKSPLRAIFAAFAIIVAGSGVFVLVASRIAQLLFTFSHRVPMGVPRQPTPLMLAGSFLLIVCVVHWFAWCNFRRSGQSVREVLLQLLVMFFAVGLVTLATILAILGPQFGCRLPFH